jgi:hypothetical protein
MSNEDARGPLSSIRQLASAWTEAKTTQLRYQAHRLQTQLDPPESMIDTERRSVEADRFQSRAARREQLKNYHQIRVDGGIVAALLEARGLMVFGVGGEFTAEQDAVADWLADQFDALDLLTLDIGTDGLFYGYSLGEVRETTDGDFGKLELIEPWTTVPELNNKGEIQRWEQKVKRFSGTTHTETHQPDDIWHFKIMKESGRDPVGMSMLGRAMTEAHAYRDNQDAIQNAVTLAGFPKLDVTVGTDEGPVIDDNELRRYRPKFNNITELTKFVHGSDVDVDFISPESFDFEGITEHDLSKLAIAFMLPVEISQLGGGDGLGTGFPARLRERLFLLSAQAQQRTVSGQLVTFGKHLIDEYAPPDVQALVGDLEDFDLRFEFNDPITDMDDLQTKVNAIGDDMTVNERRAMFDLPPLDDDSIGEDYESPGATQDPLGQPEGGQPMSDSTVELQGAGLSSDIIAWIRTYAGDAGSLDDAIGDMADWLADFADAPGEAGDRFRDGVVVFANAQGIGLEEATEQPVGRLLSYYAENRNLQDDAGIRRDVQTLLREIQAYRDGFESIVWGDMDHDLAGPAFGNDDDVPANVRNRVDEASRFVNWGDTEGVPPGNLRDFFVSKLEQPQGWSIDSLANGLREQFGARLGEPEERVNIARTKSAALLNQAKRMAFEDLEDGIDGNLLYFWDGPQDEDTTDACEQLKELTNPEHGGTPRPRQEFDSLMADVRNEFFPDFESDGQAIHWQERHALDAVLPSQADVDPAGVGGMATDPEAADD